MKKLQLNAVLASVLALPIFAHAAAVDVSGVVTDIGAQAVPIALVGGAVLLLIVGTKVFKWVQRAM